MLQIFIDAYTYKKTPIPEEVLDAKSQEPIFYLPGEMRRLKCNHTIR